jgi:PadR family transcriptional regulator PadR
MWRMRAEQRRSDFSQLRRGALEYCVMAALNEKQRYGYELVSMLGGILTSDGTIYPLLARLRKEGSVATNWQESSSGPPRRYYQLTDRGRDALERFVQEWVRFRDAVDEILGTKDRR